MHTFYEFFAGGGMVRLGLGVKWKCIFANDIEKKKAESYFANFSKGAPLKVDDVANVQISDLNGQADLAWASFPCQDLSLAGKGRGLRGGRSGTFWNFWYLIEQLNKEGRKPRCVVLENVIGLLSSHGGNDFKLICEALVDVGYKIGPLLIDAKHFLPQSRPRLFIVGVSKNIRLPETLKSKEQDELWANNRLVKLSKELPEEIRKNWIWWNLPHPPKTEIRLEDIIESSPQDVAWFPEGKVQNLLEMMDEGNLVKVIQAQRSGKKFVGATYKRTRLNASGKKEQRAEIRFDGMAGCLRTPAGGSSKQILLFIDGEKIRARHISARESARLMGIDEFYSVPVNNNQALHLTGDGVAVPVVRYLAQNILEPTLNQNQTYLEAAE